jgi:hypothetical protein
MTGVIRSAPWFKVQKNNADTKFQRRTMAQEIPKSAAQSIYAHLKSGTPAPVEQRQQPASVAAAMWPSLAPKPPKPLTQHEVKAAWLDRLMGMSGIKRI